MRPNKQLMPHAREARRLYFNSCQHRSTTDNLISIDDTEFPNINSTRNCITTNNKNEVPEMYVELTFGSTRSWVALIRVCFSMRLIVLFRSNSLISSDSWKLKTIMPGLTTVCERVQCADKFSHMLYVGKSYKSEIFAAFITLVSETQINRLCWCFVRTMIPLIPNIFL